jgi:hypothetical protein
MDPLRLMGMGLKYGTLDVVIFWNLFVLKIYDVGFELKSMQIWLGQNFTYFYVHNFSEE